MTEISCKFNPKSLEFARMRRGLTKKSLATMVGVAPRSITGFESGEYPPSSETLDKLSLTLSFPTEFFIEDAPEIPHLDTVSFRALSRMSSNIRNSAISCSGIGLLFNRWAEEQFELPRVDLVDLPGEDPEVAAETLREHWDIGQLSIDNIICLLESKGVRIFNITIDSLDIDAFSFWYNKTPFIFLNTLKSAERTRFDAVHELGHLVLHKHGGPTGQDIERQADKFASAFLMPRGSVFATAPKIITINNLIDLKKNWKVSLSALAYRMHSLNILSDWMYRSICIEMTGLGYRSKEPNGINNETSIIWGTVFSTLRVEGISKHNIANELRINVKDIEQLFFKLVLMDISIEGGSGNASIPSNFKNPFQLTLVK